MTQEQKAKAYDEAIRKAKDMLSYKEVRQEDMEYLFPELKEKESEDERIRKAAVAFVKASNHFYYHLGISKEKVIAWLEKQGKPALEAVREENVDNQNCVNPAYEVGGWVVDEDDNRVYQIVRVIESVTSDKISYVPFTKKNYHLWTIQDAKDGDLIYVGTEEKGIQAIFHEYKNGTIFFHCYLCVNFTQGGYMPIGNVDMVHPLQKIHHKNILFLIIYHNPFYSNPLYVS